MGSRSVRASIVCALYLGLECLSSGNNDNIEFPNTRLLFPVCIRILDKVIRVKVSPKLPFTCRILFLYGIVCMGPHRTQSINFYLYAICTAYQTHTQRAHCYHSSSCCDRQRLRSPDWTFILFYLQWTYINYVVVFAQALDRVCQRSTSVCFVLLRALAASADFNPSYCWPICVFCDRDLI